MLSNLECVKLINAVFGMKVDMTSYELLPQACITDQAVKVFLEMAYEKAKKETGGHKTSRKAQPVETPAVETQAGKAKGKAKAATAKAATPTGAIAKKHHRRIAPVMSNLTDKQLKELMSLFQQPVSAKGTSLKKEQLVEKVKKLVMGSSDANLPQNPREFFDCLSPEWINLILEQNEVECHGSKTSKVDKILQICRC